MGTQYLMLQPFFSSKFIVRCISFLPTTYSSYIDYFFPLPIPNGTCNGPGLQPYVNLRGNQSIGVRAWAYDSVDQGRQCVMP